MEHHVFIIVALHLLTYLPQGASHSQFETKLDQWYTTDVDHVRLSDCVGMKRS